MPPHPLLLAHPFPLPLYLALPLPPEATEATISKDEDEVTAGPCSDAMGAERRLAGHPFC